MKKSIKTLLALSLAVSTGLGLGTAYAEDGADASESQKLPQITKTLEKTESNAPYPNAEFDFTITPVDGAPNGLLQLTNEGKIVFNNEDTQGTKTLKLTFGDLDDVVPGKYKYTIKETKGNIDGISYDKSEKIFEVTVSIDENGVKSVIAVEVNGEGNQVGEDDTKTNLDFTNTYTTNPLKVTKKLAGNARNLNDKFTFTITINGAEGETYKTNIPGNETITSGQAVNFDLGHEDSVDVYGLSPADTYTVTEDEKDYTSEGEVEDPTAIGDTEKNIIVTNTKTQTVPTGLYDNIAPFALVIVVAGAFAVIYFKRNRQEA